LVVARWLARNLPVHFLGALSRSEVARLYRSSRVFAIPSEIEASPFTIIEAGVAGTPIVATNVGGMPEMIQHEHSGLLTQRGDIRGLASSITSLLTNLELAGGLAAQSRLRAISRTSAMMSQEVIQAIESAALRPTSRPRSGRP
jgi:glycosyltransferase involved in cell wall biosynthesis